MTRLPMQEAQVQLLVRELKSHIPYVMQLIIIIQSQKTPLLNILSLSYQKSLAEITWKTKTQLKIFLQRLKENIEDIKWRHQINWKHLAIVTINIKHSPAPRKFNIKKKKKSCYMTAIVGDFTIALSVINRLSR